MVREGDALLNAAGRAFAPLALAALLSSCANERAGTSGDASARDRVRFIVQADVPTLNGLINDSPITGLVDQFVMSYLFRADANGAPVPDLALRVPTVANGDLSRDGTTITYRLRRGVRWHDGVPFTARDVVFSFDLARDPRTNVPDRSEYDDIRSVRALDAATVRVRLRSPSASAVPTFFSETANDPYPILPAHARDLASDPNRAPFDAAPIGTGPYAFAQWRRGDRVILRANPAYYAGAPSIARVEVITIPNQNSFELALGAGEADVAYEQSAFGLPEPDPTRYVTRTAPIEESEFVLFNVARGPLRDVRLRHALVRAIDVRKLAAQTLPPGAARFAASDRIAGTPGFDPTLAHPTYDPDGAARELDAAGYTGRDGVRTQPGGAPLALELVATQNPFSQRMVTLIQAQLRDVGIATTIHTYPYAMFYTTAADGGIMERGRFDLAFTGWSYNGIDDRSYLYACDSRAPNGENYGGICDPAIERARLIARRSLDPAARARANATISRRLVERSYLDLFWFDSFRVIARDGLDGPVPTRLNQPAWNAARWRWR